METLILDRLVGWIPESIILWVYPSGQILNKFKKV